MWDKMEFAFAILISFCGVFVVVLLFGLSLLFELLIASNSLRDFVIKWYHSPYGWSIALLTPLLLNGPRDFYWEEKKRRENSVLSSKNWRRKINSLSKSCQKFQTQLLINWRNIINDFFLFSFKGRSIVMCNLREEFDSTVPSLREVDSA